MHNWDKDAPELEEALPGHRMLSIMTDNDLTQINHSVPTKVLVIDDDETMIEMLRLVLQPGSFAVTIASSGPKGIAEAHNLNPDIIILNLMVPDMDGWQVCKAIREFTQAPILVLSAISKPGIVAQALDEGADDYLLKPMTSSVLIAHVKRLAWRARAEQEANGSNI